MSFSGTQNFVFQQQSSINNSSAAAPFEHRRSRDSFSVPRYPSFDIPRDSMGSIGWGVEKQKLIFHSKMYSRQSRDHLKFIDKSKLQQFTKTSGFFKNQQDKKYDINPSVFSQMNMTAQRMAIKSIDNLSKSFSTNKRLRKRINSKSSYNGTMLPIHEFKKTFPELVNTMQNPFAHSGLNIALKQQFSQPGSRQMKQRSQYYKSCKGCSFNINRLIVTGSVERISTDSIQLSDQKK